MNVKIRKLRPEEYLLSTQLMREENWTWLNEEWCEMFEKKLPHINTTLVATDVESLQPFSFYILVYNVCFVTYVT